LVSNAGEEWVWAKVYIIEKIMEHKRAGIEPMSK
jgi:hypothetical protein